MLTFSITPPFLAAFVIAVQFIAIIYTTYLIHPIYAYEALSTVDHNPSLHNPVNEVYLFPVTSLLLDVSLFLASGTQAYF